MSNTLTAPQTDLGIQIATGIAMGTKVMTMEGELPVEFLCIGDRVLTRNGARKIRAITVMVANNSEVAIVSRDTLGQDRPSEDVILPVDQTVLIRDWRARALFDADQAMVSVGRLADGAYIRREKISDLRFFGLGFDGDEVVYAEGLELFCPVMPAQTSA